MSQTFSEFKADIQSMVHPGGIAQTLEFAFEQDIVQALILAQRWIRYYKSRNRDVHAFTDTYFRCGATLVPLPRGEIQRVYTLVNECCPVFYDWVQDYDEFLNWIIYNRRTWTEPENVGLPALEDGMKYAEDVTDKGQRYDFGRYTIHNHYVHVGHRIESEESLVIEWEGIKRKYEDDDLMPYDDASTDELDFGVELKQLVASFVRAEDLRKYRRNYVEAEAEMRNFRFLMAELKHQDRQEVTPKVQPEKKYDQLVVAGESCADPECQTPEEDEVEESDCDDLSVTLSANSTSIIAGTPVTLSWANVVPDVASSVVTIEYNGTTVSLARNSSGTLIVTPTVSTTYMIRAVTDCGTDIATVGVAVSAEPCLCPDGLPECLSLTADSLAAIENCTPVLSDAGDASLWDGTMPRLDSCRWGIEMVPAEDVGIGGYYVDFNGWGPAQFAAEINLISCNPLVYEMVFYFNDLQGNPTPIWKGRRENTPVGTYVSQEYGVGWSDLICYQFENFTVQGCFDAPCTPPEIRFDPPAASVVSFPTVVFIHSTNDDDNIFYSTDGEVTFQPYTGPITLATGQQVSAYSVTLAGCESSVIYASDYIEDAYPFTFEFLCDEVDKVGVFDIFEANGSNDYHWRITLTRPDTWEFTRATIYETNEFGVWVTGQAWSTINPINPIEISPTDFPVYPLLFENADDPDTAINTDYGEPVVVSYPAGQQVLHGYGQPFVALTGYFRLEMIIDEGDGPFTIYKLIPHTCATEDECPEVAEPSAVVDCDLIVTVTTTVPAGSQYRIRRTGCDDGVFNIIDENISLTGDVEYEDTVVAGCIYNYLISVYCVATATWVDSGAVQVIVPDEGECDCSSTDCPSLQNTYYIQSTHPDLQAAVQGCSHFGDLDYNDPQWDQSYSRAGTTCQWDAPSFYSYDGVYRVISDLARVVDGESCYWRIRFTGDTGAVVEYRKTTGNTPVGTYESHDDPCSGEVGFPNTIVIVGETPND